MPYLLRLFTSLKRLRGITAFLFIFIGRGKSRKFNIDGHRNIVFLTRKRICLFKTCVFNHQLLLTIIVEDEFGQWRPAWNRFGAEYIKIYNIFVQIYPPEEDFEGYLGLY